MENPWNIGHFPIFAMEKSISIQAFAVSTGSSQSWDATKFRFGAEDGPHDLWMMIRPWISVDH